MILDKEEDREILLTLIDSVGIQLEPFPYKQIEDAKKKLADVERTYSVLRKTIAEASINNDVSDKKSN